MKGINKKKTFTLNKGEKNIVIFIIIFCRMYKKKYPYC